MARNDSIKLMSFTGSCETGRKVDQVVRARSGKSILELGGNNAAIVMDDADLDLAVPAIFFATVGTAGQRCTTLRRLVRGKLLKISFESKIGWEFLLFRSYTSQFTMKFLPV